ncbi:MAG: 30S ribosomal protein S16 [Sandaracinaceae bacterium]
MVKIRLARHGAKKRPYYHIVVANSESPRDGRFLEQIGVYDPSLADDQIRLDLARVEHWLSVGAKPSERVQHLINLVRRRPTDAATA